MDKAISPLFFERYELKYFLTSSQALEVEKYVEFFCELDPYSERMEDHYYSINNLYFDTPNNLFLERRRSSIDHRFNLRIRSYGDDPVPPYLFEIKQKGHGVVKKTRAKILDDNWAKPLLLGSNLDANTLNSNIIDINSDFYHNFLQLFSYFRRLSQTNFFTKGDAADNF